MCCWSVVSKVKVKCKVSLPAWTQNWWVWCWFVMAPEERSKTAVNQYTPTGECESEWLRVCVCVCVFRLIRINTALEANYCAHSVNRFLWIITRCFSVDLSHECMRQWCHFSLDVWMRVPVSACLCWKRKCLCLCEWVGGSSECEVCECVCMCVVTDSCRLPNEGKVPSFFCAGGRTHRKKLTHKQTRTNIWVIYLPPRQLWISHHHEQLKKKKKKVTKLFSSTCALLIIITMLNGLAANMKHNITHHCVRTCAHTHTHTHTHTLASVGGIATGADTLRQTELCSLQWDHIVLLIGWPNSKKGHSRTRLGSVSVYISVFLCDGVEAPTSAQSKHVSRLTYISNSRLTDVWLRALFWTLSHVSSPNCTRVLNITHLHMFTSRGCLCLSFRLCNYE